MVKINVIPRDVDTEDDIETYLEEDIQYSLEEDIRTLLVTKGLDEIHLSLSLGQYRVLSVATLF